MILFPVFAAWCGHTEASREDAADLDGTIAATGWKKEAAAERMGLTLPQLSRQLAGQEPLNHWRLSYMPRDFQLEYLRRRAGRFGAALLTADERAFVLGFARAMSEMGAEKLSRLLPQFFNHDNQEERKRA